MASAPDNLKIELKADYVQPPVGTIKLPDYKTKIIIGGDSGIVIQVEKRFSRFNKKMMNWCFGWTVTDID